MKDIVKNLLTAALFECCPPQIAAAVLRHVGFVGAAQAASEDLQAFADKDPAARGEHETIAHAYSSYKAVAHYRLANALLDMHDLDAFSGSQMNLYASIISNRGKLLSGAEFHPRCEIGRRFVLDHGWGTVIGETALIGDDCYVLGGVTLGARGIAKNPSTKRHPTLGNRVQIGAFSHILGDINIGDDVFIGPHCVVTSDVESGASVTMLTRLQTVKTRVPMPALSPLITSPISL